MSQHAVVSQTYSGGSATWVAAKVSAAADITQQREYADLAEHDRYHKAVQQERMWIAGLWSEQRTSWAVRWLTDEHGEISLYLLARTLTESNQPPLDTAALVRPLLAAPSHVTVEPVTDQQKLSYVLNPFTPAPDGVAQISKRCLTGAPNRQEPGTPDYYFAIQPFQSTPELWPTLLAALHRVNAPTCLSVHLTPTQAHPQLSQLLDSIGTDYQRLAERTPERGPAIYSANADYGPEAFAIDAKDLYADAARRYRDTTFQINIGVYSSEPLPSGLLNNIASVIGGSERSGAHDTVSSQFAGSAATVERPADNAQYQVAARNFQTLDTQLWGGHEAWRYQHSPPDLLRQATYLVDVEEALAAFRLPVAVNGRLSGFPVVAPKFDVAVTNKTLGPTFTVGTQIVGGSAEGPVNIGVDELKTHAFFVGATGSGKSTSVQSMLHQLYTGHNKPFLVIEPVNTTRNDYRRFLTTPGYEDALVLTAGSESIAPLRFNPFQVPAGVTVGEHSSSILSAFDAAFGLWDPLPALYREALTKTYAEAGYALDSVGNPDHDWPVLRDFERELAAIVKAQNYKGDVASNIEAASLVRVRQLGSGPAGSVLNCRKSFPLETLLNRPVVVELAHLGVAAVQDQALVIALLLTTMTETIGRQNREPNALHHLTVIEEAHRLLKNETPNSDQGDSSAAVSTLFSNLLAEVRKHGESLVIVDQDPAKLIADTYKNTNLKVMHRLPYGPDREMLGSAMSFDDDHIKAAANLNTFTAFAHTAGMDRPTHIETTGKQLVEQQQLGDIATDQQVKDAYTRFKNQNPSIAEAIAPYEACDGCQSICDHRNTAAAVAITSKAKQTFVAHSKHKAQELGGLKAWHQTLHKKIGEVIAERGLTDDPDLNMCVALHTFQHAHKPSKNTTKLTRLYRQHNTPDK